MGKFSNEPIVRWDMGLELSAPFNELMDQFAGCLRGALDSFTEVLRNDLFEVIPGEVMMEPDELYVPIKDPNDYPNKKLGSTEDINELRSFYRSLLIRSMSRLSEVSQLATNDVDYDDFLSGLLMVSCASLYYLSGTRKALYDPAITGKEQLLVGQATELGWGNIPTRWDGFGLEPIMQLVKAKHKDYGSSAFKVPYFAQDVSVTDAILVRLSDKYQRFMTLTTQETRPEVNESLTDTVRDIIGYCALLWIAFREEYTFIS